MTTRYTEDPREAAAYIRREELAAFPTETVYGLGADAFSERAVRMIFEAKGRPGDNPLIAHVADVSDVRLLASNVPDHAQALIDEFFPGPLTLVLNKREHVPNTATGGLATIGVRMPDHAIARAFLTAAGHPVVAPSANRSGRPSPTSWEAVAADLDGRIACVLKGERTEAGIESTVVDCTTGVPVVLRPGVVTLEQLWEVVPETKPAASDPALLRRSPGTNYRHYAPRAKVIIGTATEMPRGGKRTAFIGITRPEWGGNPLMERICANTAEYAHELFDFFRAADAAGAELIVCEAVPESGVGVALMDRIQRAARG